MNEEEIKRWIEKLPKSELDIPLVIVDNRAYSPNELLQLIRMREQTETELELKRRLMTLDIETLKRIPVEAQLHELAKIRLKMKLERTPPKFAFARYILGAKEKYTADELIGEIQRETSVGQEFISTEKSLIRDLLSR